MMAKRQILVLGFLNRSSKPKYYKKIKKSLNVFCTSFVQCNNFVKLGDKYATKESMGRLTLVAEIKVKFFKRLEKIN